MTIHKVNQGETVQSISELYNVSENSIIENNGLKSGEALIPGQELVILTPETVYTVQPGDTVYSIAENFDISVKKLLANNPSLMGNPLIYPGQSLIISYTEQNPRNITVNGYAYPFIEESVLRKTLPYLDYLTVFTYGFTDTGELIPADDEKIISIAKSYGVQPILLISTLEESGNFNNQLSSRLFENEDAQDNLIKNLISTVSEKGYAGVDVDFEYIPKEDADNYVAFLTKLKNALQANGYKLIVSLAPKTSADQPGLLYEGHDYAAIGNIADYVLLMTYEWGYKFGPPGAVAPINNVERVIEYAVTEIPSQKILLGIPNYGYDWPLPFVSGQTEAEGFSNSAALERAREVGANIEYDSQSQSPYYYYTSEGVEHVVWFENAESILQKLNLVDKYNLAGISIWTIMKFYSPLYSVINSF